MSDNAFANREPAPKPTPPGSEKLSTQKPMEVDGGQARGSSMPVADGRRESWGLIRNDLSAFGGPRPTHVSDEEQGGVHDGSKRESTVKSALDSWPNPSIPPKQGTTKESD